MYAVSEKPLEYSEIREAYPDLRLDAVLEALQKEKLIARKAGRYIIAD